MVSKTTLNIILLEDIMKKATNLALAIILVFNLSLLANPKFDKWQQNSYFKGYNVLYESPKNLQDFIDFKNYGGNLFHIQPDGFFSPDAPYDTLWDNINGADMLVNFCRQAGVHYVIGMRSGPGAYDTFDESQQTTGESRIWNTGNTIEQQKYAEMLRMIVQRYAGDTLFTGINLVIEPRPKVRFIPANTSATYKFFLETVYNIHMDQVYTFWVSKIREVDAEIPIILESFGYSTSELFPAYEINDPYVVYSAHNYQPNEYCKSANPMTMNYPGTYWNLSTLSQVMFNADFLRNTVFSKLRAFQQTTGKPVFIGEFGMFKPQNGGAQYIKDVLDICTDYGWHFALWDWRRGGGQNWNIEGFQDSGNAHWKTVLSKFNAPPAPGLIEPFNGQNTTVTPVTFKWDSLTSFTKYDIYIKAATSKNGITISDISNSTYTYTGTALQKGYTYEWKVRSKNPGGTDANNSEWSAPQTFYIPATDNYSGAKTFSLNQNSPNPFNPSTNISFSLPKSSFVKLIVFDILGREVADLSSGMRQQGSHSISFNASDLPSGVYIYRLEATPNDGTAGYSEIRRMILIK
jgi:hypothetical protein